MQHRQTQQLFFLLLRHKYKPILSFGEENIRTTVRVTVLERGCRGEG